MSIIRFRAGAAKLLTAGGLVHDVMDAEAVALPDLVDAPHGTDGSSRSVREPQAVRSPALGPLVAIRELLAVRYRALFRRSSAPVAIDVSEPASEAVLNSERLLMLLGEGNITIRELRERGVRSPAQGLYDLRLAGHPIDRVRITHEDGRSAVEYRLGT